MNDLEAIWVAFCKEQVKAAQAKGTVGKPGMSIEKRRRELVNKLIQGGMLSKDGYTQQNEKGEFYKI